MKIFFKKGMTIVEILITLAIFVILLSIVLPQFSKIRENQVLKSTVSDIMSNLNKAQSQTLASVDSSSYGVHFQSDKVIIFKGIVFSASDSNNNTTDIVAPALISNVTLGGVSGNSGDVYFDRLSGSPNIAGTVTLSTTNYSKIITISVTGMASIN